MRARNSGRLTADTIRLGEAVLLIWWAVDIEVDRLLILCTCGPCWLLIARLSQQGQRDVGDTQAKSENIKFFNVHVRV